MCPSGDMSATRDLLERARRRVWRLLQPRDPLPRFANDPRNLRIPSPRQIRGAGRMRIGNDVDLGPYSILKVTTEYPRGWAESDVYDVPRQAFDPRIVIGDRVTATSHLHIAAFEEIAIEEEVLMASNVFLSDGSHAFHTADVPYRYQGFFRIAPIRIGRGSWLAQNVVVMPGVSVGELSIVGANSVVTQSIPDRCIAAGAPARVIRRWDPETSSWARAGGAGDGAPPT